MRVAFLLASIATLLCWGGPSYADVHKVTVEQSGQEPSCLKAQLVADALRQDATLRVTLTSQKTSDPIVLTIRGSNERFTLLLVNQGREVGQLFEGVACAAATQVATAFVMSLLSSSVVEAPVQNPIPAPVEVEAPALNSESNDIALAVQAELEARGFRPGAEGLRLSIARTTRQRWALWITNIETSCSVFRELSEDPAGGREPLVMELASLADAMRRETGSCLRPEVVERAEILKKALAPMRYDGGLTRSGAAGEAVLGIASGAFAVAADTDLQATRGLMLVASGMWIAGGLASYVMDDDPYAGTVASVSALVGAATAISSLAFIGPSMDRGQKIVIRDQRHDAFLLGGLSLYASAAILAWDRSRHPPIANSRLSKGYSRLETHARREKLTQEEVAEIEQDFIQHQSPTSIWLLVSPLLVGGALTMAAAVGEEDPGEQALFAVVGGGLLLEGLLLGALYSSGIDPLSRYRGKLKDAGLEVRLLPTSNGIAAVGRF